MPEVKKDQTHQTTTTVLFSDTEVAAILGQAALDDAKVWPGKKEYYPRSTPGRKVEIEITQQTEGSPPYVIQKWRARVVVTEDHLHVAPERVAAKGEEA